MAKRAFWRGCPALIATTSPRRPRRCPDRPAGGRLGESTFVEGARRPASEVIGRHTPRRRVGPAMLGDREGSLLAWNWWPTPTGPQNTSMSGLWRSWPPPYAQRRTPAVLVGGRRRVQRSGRAGFGPRAWRAGRVPALVWHGRRGRIAAHGLLENIQRETSTPSRRPRRITPYGALRRHAPGAGRHARQGPQHGHEHAAVVGAGPPIRDMLMAGEVSMGHARRCCAVGPRSSASPGPGGRARGMSVRASSGWSRRPAHPADQVARAAAPQSGCRRRAVRRVRAPPRTSPGIARRHPPPAASAGGSNPVLLGRGTRAPGRGAGSLTAAVARGGRASPWGQPNGGITPVKG